MNWQEIVNNRKGFIHHPETPLEDKNFYYQYKGKTHELLKIGESFVMSQGVVSHRSIIRGKEELGTNSRNLHRGVYCPSPVLDILITNSKRGKILIRPTEKSNITNRYVYDTSDKLIFIDNFIDDKTVSSEYLIYHDNIIYGITIGMSGRLISVSEEQYSKDRIESYICAFYSGEEHQMCCHQMDCEKYYYDKYGLMDWDYYQIYYGWEKVAPSGFIKHNRFRFERENGWLKSFTLVNNDGTPISGSFVNGIKMKRKAKVYSTDSIEGSGIV